MTNFTKMHGLGNDFVVFDATRGRVDLSPEKIRRLADRRFGIGCDQVLVIEPPTHGDVDFRYRFYNSNGSEAEQCGNGVRCLLRFARDKSLTQKTEIAAETLAGILRLRLEPDGQVTVDMGVPRFDPAAVPFEAPAREKTYRLAVDGQDLDVSVLSMGNPHAVQIVSDVDRAPVATQGPLIEGHTRFPERVNAGYLQVVDRTHARLRVYERGAGETLACGSGACAAMVAGRQRGLLDDKVDMALRGGSLRIAWKGEGEPVWMTGPAAAIFEGSIDLDRL